MNKPSKNKYLDTENRIMVPRGEGVWGVEGGEKWVKGINCMEMGGNQLFGGVHTVRYIEVEL